MNAKKELLEILKDYNKNVDNIVGIFINFDHCFGNYEEKEINNIEDLDIDYDNGYGIQQLDGYVLLDDNDWLERHEYDGSEWWEYKKYPSHLLKETK